MKGLSMSWAVLGAAALLVAGGGAYALAASNSGTITVCVHHNSGTLYVATTCAKHDKRLSWNKQGPGGPAGPQGTNGTNGTNAATNIRVRTATGTGSATASCQAGETPTGGGAIDDTGGALKSSYPNLGTDPTLPSGSWTAQAVTGTDSVTVRVLCASP